MILIGMVLSLLVQGAVINTAWSQDSGAPAQATAQTQPDQAAAPAAAQDNGNGGHQQEVGSSLYYTVKRGGPVMIPILLLGLVALTIIIERLIFYTRNRIWSTEQVPALLAEVAEKSGAKFREDREDELKAAFQIYVNSLERGMAFLSGIGNLAPILGFLGTVTGMITAFAAIAAATTVNARVVAVGIQEALITTAGGLMVAAPTLFFYYIFTHVIQNRFAQAEETIDKLTGSLPRLTEELPGGAREGVYNG
jgi:biopolymer transport protein ExbB